MNVNEALNILSQKFILREGIVGISHSSKILRIYVEKEEDAYKVPQTLLGLPTEVKVIGKVRILPSVGRTLAGVEGRRTDKWRPAPGGVSIGHTSITAGTLGCRVFDLRSGARMILSNNHVIAASNLGRRGDPILQPGPYDGGAYPDDLIGFLERYVPLRPPPGTNLVDAAVARIVSDDVLSDEVLDIGVIRSVEDASVGMRIAKSGRSCGYSTATVGDVNAVIRVSGFPSGDLVFTDQIVSTYLGAPGDSGSIAVNADTGAAVGLLFAGSESATIINKISNVIRLLGVGFSPTAVAAVPSIGFAIPMIVGGLLLTMRKVKK